MKKFFLSAMLGVMALTPPAFGETGAALVGTWRTSAGSFIQAYPCANGEICAKLLYSPMGRLENGALRPNALEPSQPMCGSVIVEGLRPDGRGVWKGGRVYDVEKGRRASIRVRLIDADTAQARYFKGITLLGQNDTFERTTAPAPPC